MGKLIDIARKSRLMEIEIDFKGEKIQFNLADELKVSEDKINTEIKHQPTHYGFLSMLHKSLLKQQADYERQCKKVWGISFLNKKKKVDLTTGRNFSNDIAKEYANTTKKYILLLKKYTKAKHDAGIIGSCVEAFEQRATLVQTLSANIRKEN